MHIIIKIISLGDAVPSLYQYGLIARRRGLNDDGENSFTTVFSADNWIVPEIRSLTFHRLFGKGKQTIFLGQFLVGVFFWKRLGLNFALV